MQFSSEDLRDLESRNLDPSGLAHQIHQFTHGLSPVRLEHPCTAGDGILVLSAAECHRLLGVFDSEHLNYRLQKFVPASGAASRMFKHLYNFSPTSASQLTEYFILNFDRFPFIAELSDRLAEKGISLSGLKENNEWGKIFDYILGPEGLNYGHFPKGLVGFHAYESATRTAFEEHIKESLAYARNRDGSCDIHFTLAEEHRELVLSYLKKRIESDYPFEDIRISQSTQSKASETIALDKDNEPARDHSGRFIFRPSGHGALIQNLSTVDADIVFIKNIDNVTTDSQREETIFYKKILGGLIISLKSQIGHLLNQLDAGREGAENDALDFIQHWFQPGVPIGLNSTQLRAYTRLKLDRPVRVCGMVRNEGEPGGGPFWVRLSDGHLSKQIVERSQVDSGDTQQLRIMAEATHFNPVDLVCAFKNRKGESYELNHFIDHSTGFVSEKFHDGKVIKALELPGLWNGAMALWNTVFVEVPVSTFHPVKTVNDLLRPGHLDK
jgi:hypothetical protein